MIGVWVRFANLFAPQVLDAIWRASWQGAIAIVVVWGMTRFWRRLPSYLCCLLWVAVCLKVLVALMPIAISLPYLPPNKATVSTIGSTSLPARYSIDSIPAIPVTTILERPASEIEDSTLSLPSWALFGWLAGVMVVAGFASRQTLRTYRLIKRATTCADPSVLDEVESICSKLGLSRMPRILTSHESTTILTFGVWRPVVLLSNHSVALCTEEERRMVLAHELSHIVRKDGWLGIAPQLVQTLLFFHPLVWLACREFLVAREAACDELAITGFGIRPDVYGNLLLKLGSSQRSAATLCTPGVSSQFQLLRRRISMLDNQSDRIHRQLGRRPIAMLSLACILCIAPLSLVEGQERLQTPPTKPAHNTPAPSIKRASSTSSKPSKVAKAPTKTSLSRTQKSTASDRLYPHQKLVVNAFRLNYANANRAAEVLRQLLVAGKDHDSRISVDSYSNSIFVSAGEPMLGQISDVIRKLDIIGKGESHVAPPQSPAPKTASETVVFPLRFANGVEIQGVLSKTFGNSAKVVLDGRTNSVIVIAAPDTIHDVRNLLIRLDVNSPVQPRHDDSDTKSIRLIPLRNADAKNIYQSIEKVVKQIDGVDFISYDPTQNAIVLRGTQNGIQEMTKLIALLDIRKGG